MRRPFTMPRPGWGGPRSPAGLVAAAASVLSRSPYAEAPVLRRGRIGRWADGVGSARADCGSFARHWDEGNARALAAPVAGPLWVVLGDSTAQGIGAPGPGGGYVGQSLRALRERTGQDWRVLNLSVSGALIRDVLGGQLPAAPPGAALVTCGVGANDVLFSVPSRLFADLRALLAAVPGGTVMLDLPLPRGLWWPVGPFSLPYVSRVNRVLREAAAGRGLPVAAVSAHFTPPWAGKLSADSFHPSELGYRDWSRALLAAIPAALPAA